MWCLPRSPPGGQVRVRVVSQQGTIAATSFLYDDGEGESTEYHTLRAECWQECRPDFNVVNFTSAFKFLRLYGG
jgi:hypothetical protein